MLYRALLTYVQRWWTLEQTLVRSDHRCQIHTKNSIHHVRCRSSSSTFINLIIYSYWIWVVVGSGLSYTKNNVTLYIPTVHRTFHRWFFYNNWWDELSGSGLLYTKIPAVICASSDSSASSSAQTTVRRRNDLRIGESFHTKFSHPHPHPYVRFIMFVEVCKHKKRDFVSSLVILFYLHTRCHRCSLLLSSPTLMKTYTNLIC